MEAKVRRDIEVTIIMTEDEARWLMQIVQNPLLNDPDPDTEPPIDRKMRRLFWDVLYAEGIRV
jgi:hypothetical protein